jgi:hypothetical protein
MKKGLNKKVFSICFFITVHLYLLVLKDFDILLVHSIVWVEKH